MSCFNARNISLHLKVIIILAIISENPENPGIFFLIWRCGYSNCTELNPDHEYSTVLPFRSIAVKSGNRQKPETPESMFCFNTALWVLQLCGI